MVTWLASQLELLAQITTVGVTVLQVAAVEDHLEVVKWLADHPGLLAQTKTGKNTLHWAVANGHEQGGPGTLDIITRH